MPTANAGYKAFATGDVLTAAQVQYNLQNQTIMYFANSTARNTALTGVVVEGMFCYLADTNAFEYYDGAAWQSVSSPGDITAVTAGTGLSGGGTSGGVTLSIDTATTVDLATAQTLTNKTLTSPTINDPKLNLTLNAQTGTTYTFVLADNGKLVTASNASAQTYSIPTNASVAFPIGTQINLIQIGAGQVTVSATTPGTTSILSNAGTAAGPKCRNQYAALTAIKVATDAWYVIGDIA
jgi:hypothetical protein